MSLDGSYHEDEAFEIADVEICNFLASIGWKHDKEKIEEFAKNKCKDFAPYIDEKKLVEMVLHRLAE